MGKNQQKNDVGQPATGTVASEGAKSRVHLPRVSRSRVVLALVLLVVLGTALFFGLKLHSKKVQEGHVNSSINQATKGNYKEASNQLIAAYNNSKDPADRADKARTIALDYYYAHDVTNGDKWMITAEQGFRSVKDYERASNAAETRLRFHSLNAETPAQSQNTGPDSAL